MDYYIVCPAGIETGGPELAHQLCHMLSKMGEDIQAYMYYYYINTVQTEPADVEACEKYRKYGTKHVKSISEMKKDSIVIVPEGCTMAVETIPVGKKVVWWMSVDNYILGTREQNLKILEKKAVYHLVQSEYARNYLLKRTDISPNHILFVSDYIGDSYGQFIFPAQYRQNMALFNPRKGYEDICPLIEATPWLKWVPLEGLTEEQMIVLMQAAKVYVDFGHHPGKDRIPREAASCGCCVITNRKGSAAFHEDVPIKEEYKFEDVPGSYGKIADLLKDICDNYEKHMKNFEEYRKFIAGEKERFTADVKHMTEIFRKDFGTDRKNILLIKTVSRYGSINRYVEEWASAIRKLGCNTFILDGYSLAQSGLCRHVLSSYKFDVVMDVDGIGCEWGITNALPPEVIYGIYLCDPPITIRNNLEKTDGRTIVFSCDKHFRDYVGRFFPMTGYSEFIPLSGSAYPEQIPYEERDMDIIFTGTYQEPEAIKKQLVSKFGQGALGVFLNDMLEDIIVNPQYTMAECLSRTLKKYGQEVNDADFNELVDEFWQVDFYSRFYYRDKIIRALTEAGLKIHVFGQGWENFDSEYKENIIMHEGGAYAAEKALANARIALNIMPWFKDAFQERIAAAMLSRVVAVTDESKYTTENFEDNEELLIFSLKDIKYLPGRIIHLLAHPKEAVQIAENGYRKVQNHTWYHRTCDMLQKMEEVFGISLIQEGEGRELEIEMEYPYEQMARLDAAYELYKMAELADNDVGKIEKLSETDLKFLLDKFDNFMIQFGKHLTEKKMSGMVREFVNNTKGDAMKEAVEIFSMQCKALAGELLLEEKGLKLQNDIAF